MSPQIHPEKMEFSIELLFDLIDNSYLNNMNVGAAEASVLDLDQDLILMDNFWMRDVVLKGKCSRLRQISQGLHDLELIPIQWRPNNQILPRVFYDPYLLLVK